MRTEEEALSNRGFLVYNVWRLVKPQEKTMIRAEDLWPLLLKMPSAERRQLARLALAAKLMPPEATDGERYLAMPELAGEFTGDDADDPLAWEGDGWEDIK